MAQIFVQSPELSRSTAAISLSSSSTSTLGHLKFSLLPPSLSPNSLFFSLSGKPISDSTLLSSIPPFSTLSLSFRLPGGGGDGGATGAESRDCYLKMYAIKKPDKVDPNETRLSRWTTCSLSGEPLKAPIVIDRLGNLFNKEALVQALIFKRVPKEFGYIRGLKDMIEVELSEISGEKNREVGFQCPVTGLEFNGKYPFFAIKGCGHVLSSKAFKEVKSSACLVCHAEFSENDKIVINGSAEEVKVLRERMEAEKGKVKGEKKEKKVSGMKHALDGKKVENGVKEDGGGKGAKRCKAAAMIPANATKEVYASIFTSSKKSDLKETFTCRSLPLGRN